MEQRVWILGAGDPEMKAIECLLRECEETVVYATGAQGRRVHPGSAYNASVSEVTADVVYEIECMVTHRDRLRAEKCVTIDHHRVGDPGYGKPPVDFLSASSIGQVIVELCRLEALRNAPPATWRYEEYTGHPYCGDVGFHYQGSRYVVVRAGDATAWVVPPVLVLTAAADHCLGAAYQGKCPGVDPEKLMQWRVESRARFQRRHPTAVLADVSAAMRAVREAWLGGYCTDCESGRQGEWECSTCCGRGWVPSRLVALSDTVRAADMRSDPPIPELPEAAARLGIGYVSGPLIGPEGRERYTCSGTAEQVRAFLDCWAPKEGLVDLYGDPARGFAGGYVR